MSGPVARGLALVAVLVAVAAAAPAQALETIREYGSDIRILADGSLEVTETLRVQAEGTDIRRGIYRDFPTRYRDRFGNRVVVGFELLGVERDGRPEPSFTESMPNGIRINTGNDDFLPVPQEHAFTIRYRTTRQLGFFDAHDELYFNSHGHDWVFPIERAWTRVHLPADVPRGQLQLTAYNGPQGAQGGDWTVAVEDARTVYFESTRTLMPREGMTVVVGFPKGLVVAPTTPERTRWFFRDNAGALVGVAGLLGLLAFYGWRWHMVGRDPPRGPVFPRYEPPADLTPGEVRMLSKLGYDTRAFAADVVAMAVAGFLEIHDDGGDWRLVRGRGDASALPPSQAAIAQKLFSRGREVVLEDGNAALVGGARSAQDAAMGRRLSPRYFVANGGSLLAGVLGSTLVGVVAFMASGGNGIPLLVALGVLGIVAHAVFAVLLKAPTTEGRRRLDEIEGLKMYLSVAERDEIGAMALPGASRAAPALDAPRYEALLPYAMALDVEAKWTDKFTAAVGVAEAQRSQPGWYHGRTHLGLAGLGTSLGSQLTSQIASAATPPGSSSGGGGGGFSGGGGGGGGGGGR